MSLVNNKIIRIEEVILGLDDDESLLKSQVADILNLPENHINNCELVKKNIDSRHKHVQFVYSVDVLVKDYTKINEWGGSHRIRICPPYIYKQKSVSSKINKRIVIVGSGPCGLFAALQLSQAGLKPLLIERGKDIDARVADVNKFWINRDLNLTSNIQFGEGGAGTFSDGKLYSGVNDPRTKYLFSELIKAGAPAEIAVNAAPHIGTDKLRQIVKNIRLKIIKLGATVRFETCLTDFQVSNGKIESIIVNNKEQILVDDLVLAVGHSARDTYQLLYDKQLAMKAKSFAIGLRIEHQAALINKAQYGAFYQHPKLSAARYKLVQQFNDNHPVYSFCMCPGGYVVGAASEKGGVVTNGMSEYAQNSKNSNSALLVPVTPSDLNSIHPLAGIEFQRKWEQASYKLGGHNYSAPVQLLGDFLNNQPSKKLGNVLPSYQPGFKLTSINDCLPIYIRNRIKEAIPFFEKKIHGFADHNAILTGVETRSSAPLQLERNDKLESNILGIYPAGEGAGYAGGIVSSALDGLIVAEKLIDKYSHKKK